MLRFLIIAVIFFIISKKKKDTSTGKVLKMIALAFAAIYLIITLKGCMIKNNINVTMSTAVDTSGISVDTGEFNKLTTPVGVGEFSFEKDKYGDGMYFCIEVIKNSNIPWCGAISGEIEFFDKEGNTLGMDVDKTGDLRNGMGGTLRYGFSVIDEKIVYNKKEIAKIVLTNLYEEDDLHNFLKSNFINKKNELQKCIDEKNYHLFYTKLESVRNEYNRDEFPDENVVLDDMEQSIANVNEKEKISNKNNDTEDNINPQYTENGNNVSVSSQKKEQQQTDSSNGSMDCWIYDIQVDDSLLTRDLGFGEGYNIICFFTTYDSKDSKTADDFEGVFFTTEEKGTAANIGTGWNKLNLKRIGDKKINVLGMDSYLFIHY